MGWTLGNDALTRVVPGLVSMKPNAAVAFLLAGSALWTLQGRGRARRISLGLAVSVLAIAGLTLFEYASGIGLGIDELLAREPPNSVGSLHPGRMHPTTAFDFALLAWALALVASGRRYRTAQGLALFAALIAMSTLTGYVYGMTEFVGIAMYNQMALHTAAGMLVLAAGILLARPDRGLMEAITADTAGGLMARRLLPVTFFVPVVLNGVTMMAQRAAFFDAKFAAAIRSVAAVAVFFAFIGRAAHLLHRSDLERRRVSDGLRSALAKLEAQVGVQAAVEVELRASEQRYRFLADAMPQVVWTARPDGEVDYYNRQWYDYTNTTFEQTRGWGWKSVVHPDDLQNLIDRWTRAFRSGSPYEFEYRLMDVQMPEMDGLEATAAIRSAEQVSGSHVPIIALTAYAMKGDRERFLDAGFDAYVPKPIQSVDLSLAIDRLLSTTGERPASECRGRPLVPCPTVPLLVREPIPLLL